MWTRLMNIAFEGASNLTFAPNAGTPDMSQVTNMSYMFRNATNFDEDISGWNIANVTDMEEMFLNVTLSNENYEVLLLGWINLGNLQNNVTFHAGNSRYCSSLSKGSKATLVGATNSWNITDGGVCAAPSLSTPTVTALTNISATLNGKITSAEASPLTQRGFVYSSLITNQNLLIIGGTNVQKTLENSTEIGDFSADITLTPGATYNYRAYAINGEGTKYTDKQSFTAPATATAPVITTTSATMITYNSAVVGGNITSSGGEPITEKGVLYSNSSEEMLIITNTSIEKQPTNNTDKGIFTEQLTGLTAGKYYFKAYATNNINTTYGDKDSLTVFTADDHFVLKIRTTTDGESFTFYTQDTEYDIDWNGDGDFIDTKDKTNVSGNQTINFPNSGDHIIRFRNLTDILINNQRDKNKYISVEQWGTAVWDADMSFAFWGASKLTFADDVGIPNFSEVTNLTSMQGMFNLASSFNQDIGDWNIFTLASASQMFRGATSFNQNIGNWNFNLSGNGSFSSFLKGATLSPENYDALLIGLNTQTNLRSGKLFHGGNSKYTAATVAARANLIAPTSQGGHGWTIQGDGGLSTANTAPTGLFLSSINIEENSGIEPIIGILSNTNTGGTYQGIRI